VIAESGTILEYLAERFSSGFQDDLAHLLPAPGSDAYWQYRFWMHYAEGSLMNWLVMKLVFMKIPTQPMPFFVKPIAKALCEQVQVKLIDPNVATALAYMESHLQKHTWFAGEFITLADFQMSFAVEAALARGSLSSNFPKLAAYKARLMNRSAYQRAIAKGGPVVMA
jgi:glutathione S-transferase